MCSQLALMVSTVGDPETEDRTERATEDGGHESHPVSPGERGLSIHLWK